MTREVYTCPHCLGNADKLGESKGYVKIKCRECEDVIELDKVDL